VGLVVIPRYRAAAAVVVGSTGTGGRPRRTFYYRM
jgi:hypothetical protein